MQINRQIHSVKFYKECSNYINEGHSLKETSEKFNINYTTLRYNLTKLGFRQPTRIGKKNKMVSFNEHYFDNIDTHNKAYFLGFMLSDGYICKTSYSYEVGLGVQSKDSYILEELKKELSATSKISKYKNSKKIVFKGSKHIFDVLCSYGFRENKSHFDYSVPSIPNKFFNSFVRGYFDGDGCISIKSTGYSVTSICCNSKVFIQSLKVKLENANITNCRIVAEKGNRKNILYVLYITRKENQKAFMDFIYQNDDIKLIRKYNKFKSIPW